MKAVFLVFMMMAVGAAGTASGQGLQVTVTGIRNGDGVIRLGFFTDDASFREEKPLFKKIVPKSGIRDGVLTVHYNDIPKGRYGIALLDDENRNGRMDYRFFVPTEGFGFSDYYHTGLRKPSFDDFDFQYDGGTKHIRIRISYL